MKNHVTPFIAGLKDLNKDICLNKVHFEFYLDEETGHNPLNLNETLYHIYKTKG